MAETGPTERPSAARAGRESVPLMRYRSLPRAVRRDDCKTPTRFERAGPEVTPPEREIPQALRGRWRGWRRALALDERLAGDRPLVGRAQGEPERGPDAQLAHHADLAAVGL